MLNRRISILDPKFPIPKTLNDCIIEEHNVDYRQFSLLDRAELYRYSNGLLCKDVLQSSSSEKKMCMIVHKTKKLLKEERVATKAKPIKKLESKSVALGFNPDDTTRSQSLL